MENNSISMISEDSENSNIRINTDYSNPILEYKNKNNKWVSLLYSKHLAKVSDLYFFLREKYQGDNQFLGNDGRGGVQLLIDSSLDLSLSMESLYSKDSNVILYTLSDPVNVNTSSYINLEKFCEKVMNIKNSITLNDSSREEIIISLSTYYDLVNMLNFINHKKVIDLISFYGYKYTNTLNVNSYISSSKSDSTNISSLRLGISYIKNENEYSYETFFNPHITELSEDNSSPVVFNETKDISIEYINGSIRIFPKSSEITECIISYCYLIYE